MKIRYYLALWLAKTSYFLLKLLGFRASNFPGEVALKIDPDFLKHINKPKRIIAVTGTNGKTTVMNMVADAFEILGYNVLSNREGSNIMSGISTSLLRGVNYFGKSSYEIGVIEVDERSSKRVYPYLNCEVLIVTNLFRDSIMRNAHPGYIRDFLNEAINDSTTLVLNADDVITSSLKPNSAHLFFGIEKLDTDEKVCHNLINDAQICLECHGPLVFDTVRYHHIGRLHCSKCEFKSKAIDVGLRNVNFESKEMEIYTNTNSGKLKIINDGVFNLYNVLATFSGLLAFKVPFEDAIKACLALKVTETRHLEEKAGDVKVIMQMAKEKNALACSRAFDFVAHQPNNKELFLMMNCLGDEKDWSENTCWLYDCDFEFLNDKSINHIVVCGARAYDYRLRLLLAGVAIEKISCELDEMKATALLEFKAGSDVYIFYGTDSYNLALKVRKQILKLARESKI